MRRSDSGLLFSATDLMGYLGCPHATLLDMRSSPDVSPVALDEEQELLTQKGVEHERRYLESLISSGISVAAIPADLPLERQLAATLEAMRRGTPVIYQATLLRAPWHVISTSLSA